MVAAVIGLFARLFSGLWLLLLRAVDDIAR
jgi:hypothetical protein